MDVVVIGGGIAGVLSAARLAAAGREVVLLERNQIGSEATVANHGIVHSGAMYAQFHPSVVPFCQEAQDLVNRQIPEAVVGRFQAVYYGRPERMKATVRAWTRCGLPWESAARDGAAAPLHRVDSVQCAVVEETIVAARELMVDMTARALTAGVRILDATAVTGLRQRGSHWVVTTGSGFQFEPRVVVCTAGAANARLLAAVRSIRAGQVRSRLEVMVAVPTAWPPTPTFCLDYGGPTVVPTRSGVLVSLHGAPRVDVGAPTRLVPLERSSGIVRAALAVVPELAAHMSDAVAYSCVKTELVDRQADGWGSRPAAAVLDHAGELLPGLFTVVPGKMTLAFQASAEVAGRILGGRMELPLPAAGSADDRWRAETLVALEPWRSFDEHKARRPVSSSHVALAIVPGTRQTSVRL